MSGSDGSRAASAGGVLHAVPLDDLLAELERRADSRAGDGDAVVRGVLSLGVRLYSGRTQAAGAEFPPTTDAVSTTDAVTVACALTRQQNLTPFDLALWFGRTPGGHR